MQAIADLINRHPTVWAAVKLVYEISGTGGMALPLNANIALKERLRKLQSCLPPAYPPKMFAH